MLQGEPQPSLVKRLTDSIRRLLSGKPPSQPGAPYAYVTAPVRRGPKGRSGAAVAEIEEDSYRSFPSRRT
jgi:hypothetical protein